ncbi:MAG TPA: hypothetical protein ENN65_09040 [Candidatus Hydrogenedentes bacterium]|nr:hypothetical protein [Candidatus Hydrogenedentota bacterium]
MRAFSSVVLERVLVLAVACVVLVGIADVQAKPLRIAFLAAEPSIEEMGPHNLGAWETAKTLGDATLLFARNAGDFADASAESRNLADFDVVWHHQGDAIAYTILYRGVHLAALRRFAEGGGGVLLSGGALAIIDSLGMEPDVRAQRRELDHYRDPAAMVVVEKAHRVFAGLAPGDDGLIWLSNGGCRAVADFYWGGPGEGMVLGNTPDGVQRPLVEYAIGAGRIILFGWRWPDYADLDNPHRANLLTITANILKYLATPESWHPVVIRSKFPAVAHPDEPGVAAPRWQALRLAIEDLMRDFPDDYPHGAEYLAQLDALRADHDRLPRDAGYCAIRRAATRGAAGESADGFRPADDDPTTRRSPRSSHELSRQRRPPADRLRKHARSAVAGKTGRPNRNPLPPAGRPIHRRY